ncbi:MAG TPA: hypothetical protein VEA79_13975, partial [Phenylobacterium sp.]|nr:hypothetical protein [Phenylobacterium sp.]
PLAPLALGWVIGWRTVGWPQSLLGGALVVGVVATPLAGLAFAAALAAIKTPWPWSAPETKEAPANRGFLKAFRAGSS